MLELVVSVLVAFGAPAIDWKVASPDYALQFPRDHFSHAGFKTEWWYFTGELSPGTGPARFGYQFTVFRVGVVPQAPALDSRWATTDLFMGHAAVIDLTTGHRVYSEVLHRTAPFLARFAETGDSVIAWSRAAGGTDGEWLLRWNGGAFDFSMRDDRTGLELNLTTTPARPMVRHGRGGYHKKGEGPTQASMYYSFTRLATTGSLTFEGRRTSVTGVSWMDHEFGSNQLGGDQVGWDWFSVRLEDGRDLMLASVRSRTGGADYRDGTLVLADGSVRSVGAEWTLDAMVRWRSDVSEGRYPTEWTITIPSENLTLRVRAVHQAQENFSELVPSLYYWEGAVTVETADGMRGVGFAELTGYGRNSRLPL